MSPNDEYWNQQPSSVQPQIHQSFAQQSQEQMLGQEEAPSRLRMPSQAQPGLSAQSIEEAQNQPATAQMWVAQPAQAQRPAEFRPQPREQFGAGRSVQASEFAQAQPQPKAAQRTQVPQSSWPQQPSVQTVPQTAGNCYASAASQASAAGYAAQSANLTASPTQKKGRGWIIAIVAIMSLLLFMCFTVYACTSTVSNLSTISTPGNYGLDGVEGDAIAVIELDGTIQYDGTACSPEGLKELLDRAQDNEHVKAVVLRVNSGGGTATAGEEMAEYLRQFSKPIVVSSASINASAAYEISSQADYIYVAKSTEIGAIGTVMQVTDLSGLFEKLGIRMETIASAASKDSSYGYRALTDEERQYYQDMITQINDMFVDNVAKGRKMKEEDVRKLATGLVFTGATAVENGLADAIGTREDAVKKAAELGGASDYSTVDLTLNSYDLGSLSYLLGEDSSSASRLLKLLEQADGAKLRQ